MTAQELVDSPLVQKLMEQIDTDADAALEEWKSLAGSASKDFPPSLISAYNADGAALDKAMGDFNAEWNRVVFGKATDSGPLIAAYSRYVLALTMLEEQSHRIRAVVDSKLAEFAAGFIALLIVIQKAAGKRFQDLEKELTELKKLLEDAKRKVKEAEIQRALNLIVTGISLALGPATVTARVLVAVGGITVHTIIDASLGPSAPSALGEANTVVGEIAGVHPKLSTGAQKLGGALSALVTLKMDGDEIAQARKIVEQVRTRLKKAHSEYVALEGIVKNHSTKLAALHKSLEGALAAVRASVAKYKASTSDYDDLKKEFEKWK